MAMTLRLTDEQNHALTLLAASQGRSKHDAAVRAIVTAAARMLDDARVTALARDLVDDYAATESRLRRTRP